MIGNNIYKLRKQRGLTLSELAERAKISKSYLNNIERCINCNPSIQLIGKILNALKVDISVLTNAEKVTPLVEDEWIYLFNGLKDAGIKIEEIRSNSMLMDYIKWRQEKIKVNDK